MSTSDGISCEVLARGGRTVVLHGSTVDGLLDEIERTLAGDTLWRTFALAFDRPVPAAVRERVTRTVEACVLREHRVDQDDVGWVDDLVDEDGWSGVRAHVDPSLAPCFSGHPDGGDTRHVGVWADDATFLHIRVDDLRGTGRSADAWVSAWVVLSHWHPGSATSGSWETELLEVDPGRGASVLLELTTADDDGLYWSVAPRPADPEEAAAALVATVQSAYLNGAQSSLIALVAYGFPADGSARAFPIDLLPDTMNPGYEISELRVSPPADVMASVLPHGRLDLAGVRRLRDAIRSGAAAHWGGPTLEQLAEEWHRLLARLDAIAGDEAAPASALQRPAPSDPAWATVLFRELVNVHAVIREGDDVVVVRSGWTIEFPPAMSRKLPGNDVRYRTRDVDAVLRAWDALPDGCVMLDPTGPELVVWTGDGFTRHLLSEVDDAGATLDRTGRPDVGHLRLPAGTTIRPDEGGFVLPDGEYLRLYASGIVRVPRGGRPPRERDDTTLPQHLAWRIRVGGNPHSYGPQEEPPSVLTLGDVEVVLPRVLVDLPEHVVVEVCRTIARRVETAQRSVTSAGASASDAPLLIDLSEEVAFEGW